MLDRTGATRLGLFVSVSPLLLVLLLVVSALLGVFTVPMQTFAALVAFDCFAVAALLLAAPEVAVNHGVQLLSPHTTPDPPSDAAEAQLVGVKWALLGVFSLLLPSVPGY